MQAELIVTGDGSHTVLLPNMEVTYHSKHGAVQESYHIFLQEGFHFALPGSNSLNIFELGFGTGLNAWLTMKEAEKCRVPVYFHSIEPYPLPTEITNQLNYVRHTDDHVGDALLPAMHSAPFDTEIRLGDFFFLTKYKCRLEQWHTNDAFDVIYYDAFSPRVQPELWTQEIFEKLFAMTAPGGCLLTYCSKAIVRKAMQAAGYLVSKPPGPWGKREIVRAIRPDHELA